MLHPAVQVDRVFLLADDDRRVALKKAEDLSTAIECATFTRKCDTVPPCVWLVAANVVPTENREDDSEEVLVASNDFLHEEVVETDSTADYEHEFDSEDALLDSNIFTDVDGSEDGHSKIPIGKCTQPNDIEAEKENTEWAVVQSDASMDALGSNLTANMCKTSTYSPSSPSITMEEQLLAMVEMELNKDNDGKEENVYEVDSSSDSDSDCESNSESEDEEEKKWHEKQRRIDKLSDILVRKDFPLLSDANTIVNIHKKDKKKLKDTVKVKRVYFKDKVIKRTREREIRSRPQQILREVVLRRAKFYKLLAFDREKLIKGALNRQEEAMNFESQWTKFIEEESTVPMKIERKASEIVHLEYPNLCVAENIIRTHKRYGSRLHETQKEGGAFHLKLGRAYQSEPRTILKKNVLRAAQNYKWYTNQRKEALKQALMIEN
ncbi:hypothetical protein PRIPAC_85216 [Pristionchus pacificus]|uniref:Uncharacterized protein n=1 Tax=Pristionchus pacificus TaxID=54126 RepID=A0A2A6BUJ5_PRIPA|nr:hypothetical protein PRIPAC_85216 [Pristionchus pacificus]|eukprot:PDM69473.1 hypothetical protein PRIPAC_44569 [Pristionchus pacificus]